MGTLCDGCDELVTSARFACTACLDFDLCEACYLYDGRIRSAHASGHAFLCIPHALRGRVLVGGSAGPRFHPSALALLEPTQSDKVASTVVSTAGVISRYTRADLPRIMHIEQLCFGDEAYPAHMLAGLMVPDRNAFLDAMWCITDAAASIDTAPAAAAGPARSLSAISAASPTAAVPSEAVLPAAAPLRKVQSENSASLIRAAPQKRDAREIMGYIAYELKDALGSPGSDIRHSYIISMAVHPAARKRGIGSALLGHVVAACRLRRVDSIRLHVRVSNVAAQALYARHGFVVERRRVGYYSRMCSPFASRDDQDAFVMVAVLMDGTPCVGEAHEECDCDGRSDDDMYLDMLQEACDAASDDD